MNFYVTEKVFEKMPNVVFGLVSVKGVDNTKDYDFIHHMLNESISSCENYFEGKVVKQ